LGIPFASWGKAQILRENTALRQPENVQKPLQTICLANGLDAARFRLPLRPHYCHKNGINFACLLAN
jgi:hypothetical protein